MTDVLKYMCGALGIAVILAGPILVLAVMCRWARQGWRERKRRREEAKLIDVTYWRTAWERERHRILEQARQRTVPRGPYAAPGASDIPPPPLVPVDYGPGPSEISVADFGAANSVDVSAPDSGVPDTGGDFGGAGSSGEW